MRHQLLFILLFLNTGAMAQGFLKAEGMSIRDGNNKEVILRGMGLGGWMLQEPYMMKLSGYADAQYDIRNKIMALIGKANTGKFYDAWLKNHCSRKDIDSLAAWGFNSVRLPMHYNLYTLPVDEEPVKGKQTWLSRGFELTDSLLAWCKANHIYLILDLHAVPGGQGNDNAISDRDASKPSLWQSEANRIKTIALWKKIAARYAGEKWIGGYDIINETNWGFQDKNDKNGCAETGNRALKKLLADITAAIRKVDNNHIIYIEGNCWANNYNGLFPLWDKNMVVSFHKYWNFTTDGSIKNFIDYRQKYNVPIWVGETGENSNAWFTDVVSLLERNGIGWAMWPLKKPGLNNPLQVKINDGAQKLLDYWAGKAVKPSPEEAFTALMQWAEDTKIENNIIHRDVADAMIRQVNSAETIPYKENIIHPNTILFASDYDIGKAGFAYHDADSAEYWVSTNKRTPWNSGGQYRNDGVDIEKCSDVTTNGYDVGWIETGEWLQYSIYSGTDANYDIGMRYSAENKTGQVKLILNNDLLEENNLLPQTGGNQQWKTITIKNIKLVKGWNRLRVMAVAGGFNLNYLQFMDTGNTTQSN